MMPAPLLPPLTGHTRTPRQFTDAELAHWEISFLYEFAGDCDVEPADEKVCDACAAYLMAQLKEELS
jgi:hypothetical protein